MGKSRLYTPDLAVCIVTCALPAMAASLHGAVIAMRGEDERYEKFVKESQIDFDDETSAALSREYRAPGAGEATEAATGEFEKRRLEEGKRYVTEGYTSLEMRDHQRHVESLQTHTRRIRV